MPRRKYADLAHLSPEEYKVEAGKRIAKERKGYFQVKYVEKKDQTSLEESKKRLEEAIAIVNARLAELGSPQLSEKN